jgi:hypothetical protein
MRFTDRAARLPTDFTICNTRYNIMRAMIVIFNAHFFDGIRAFWT